jgi:hypothetical protein
LAELLPVQFNDLNKPPTATSSAKRQESDTKQLSACPLDFVFLIFTNSFSEDWDYIRGGPFSRRLTTAFSGF